MALSHQQLSKMKYQQKAKSISSTEPNYFVHFAMRYHVDKALRPLPSEKGLMTIYKGNLFVFGGYSEAPESYRAYPVKPLFNFDSKSHPQWPRYTVCQ